MKGKEQITINDFANILKDYKDELIILNKKRNSEINFDKIANLQKNNRNKLIDANNSENKKKKIDYNINYNSLDKNINQGSWSKIQNNQKMENNSNQSNALLIDFYKLYLQFYYFFLLMTIFLKSLQKFLTVFLSPLFFIIIILCYFLIY